MTIPPSPSVNYSGATEQLWRTYGAINEWIRFADAKAAALLTVNGVILSAGIAALNGNRAYLDTHRLVALLAVIGAGASVVSGFYCLDCILPKTKVGGKSSLLFFDDISARHLTAKSYLRASRRLGHEKKSFVEISRQVWAVSKVAHKKHRQIACAVWALGAGFVFAILTGLAVVLLP